MNTNPGFNISQTNNFSKRAAFSSATAALNSAVQNKSQTGVKQAAEEFEAVYLSQMLGSMFEGISTEAPFGGGHAEETWRGFLVEEYGKQIANAGGIGLAGSVQRELLDIQEQTR